MSSFRIFDIAGSAMSAQSLRLNTVASNLANADSVGSDPDKVYKSRMPVFRAEPGPQGASTSGVQVLGVVESNAPAEKRYMPGNPLADSNGYVYAPNVNSVEDMVNMISASRSYQANVDVLNTAKQMALQTLSLGK
jgi:flagellar basal-body rod protein FlgC